MSISPINPQKIKTKKDLEFILTNKVTHIINCTGN